MNIKNWFNNGRYVLAMSLLLSLAACEMPENPAPQPYPQPYPAPIPVDPDFTTDAPRPIPVARQHHEHYDDQFLAPQPQPSPARLAAEAKIGTVIDQRMPGGVINCDNPVLQKYNCSVSRVEEAAINGDPDAEYALGYLHYYGEGVPNDPETAKLWMDRAAQQGQPEALKAERLLTS